MRLTYWYAECLADDRFSVVGPSKKQVVADVLAAENDDFLPPIKKVITYHSAFNLFEKATGSTGGRGCGYV